MKYASIIALAVATVAAAPVFAGSTQVVATPGVSLTEAAQAKFNRDTRGDDRHEIVVRGTPSGEYDQLAASAGISPAAAEGLSLEEVFVAKINRETGGNADQLVKKSGVTAMSRSISQAGHAQLVASAGLSADEAKGMTLGEIAAAKFARDSYSDD